MKISGGRNLHAFWETVFKKFDKSRDYFQRKYKYLVKFYLRFYRRRRHTVIGNVLKFHGKRAVIAHNILRIKGGLRPRRQKTNTRVVYGFPIATRPKRKLRCKKKNKKKLPVQLQNVSSTTQPLLGEKRRCNGENENIAQKEDAAVSIWPVAPAAKSIVIRNSEKTHANHGTFLSKTGETTPLNSEFDESGTNNIWNLDLATVALEMTDENLESVDEDGASGNTNGTSVHNISCNDPVSTSTPILAGNRSIFRLSADRQASPVEDINDKLRRQLKLLKMGKTDKTAKITPETPIITKISLRRNTIAAKPVKSSFTNDKLKSNETSTKSASQEALPAIATNGSSRNSTDAPQTPDKEATSKSKITGGLIDSLFARLKSFGERQTSATPNSRPAAIKRRSNTPLGNDELKVKTSRTSLDRRSGASSSPLTVREMLSIKRAREQTQPDDEDNVSTCSSSNADFLGFDVSNKNIDVSALLPTPRVPKSSKGSVFVSEDLDAFMKENSLENVANVEIVVAAKVGNVDEALITDAAQPPTLTIPERPVDMQRPRTLAEKRLIVQRQKDVHYQMIEHESTVYHELKKRVKMGSLYRNQPLRSIQDAEIPFTRDCWRATCWINTDNNYFFYRTIVCSAGELKLAGGRGNNKTKLFCEFSDDIDDVKSIAKPRKCKCRPIVKIKINNYNEHRMAIENNGKTDDSLATVKKLNNLKREYIRPCPLSKKPKAAKRTSLDIEYGALEILTLPTVQLEVWPKVGKPLPDKLIPVMKTVMPEGNLITTEWAQFSVSVVVASKPSPTPQRPTKQQRKFKRPPPEERKSFVFDIPYVNNQTKIIVRRRRHPFVGNRERIREPIETFYQSDPNDLKFAKNVDRSDAVASECANTLAAMIESVAVTLNENNFIRMDPDLDYVGKIVPIKCVTDTTKSDNDLQAAGKDKIVGTAKMDKGTSKLKVMKELKRLNVTIINAVPDEKPNIEIKPEDCKQTFCRLGCVCESMANATPISNRCSNVKCMLVCKCSSSANQPHFNVPVDLLNKDLGSLHARATARLAKEEKDFTSTIVVSDHDMFVLPNSVRSTKRNTKKPKRYNECLDDYDSLEERDTTLHAPPTPKRVRHAPVSNEYAYDQNIIDSMRHVNVQVKKLPELEVEAWCMVHCLYKCFCNGMAIEGKPFSFTNASSADKPIDDSSNHVVDEIPYASSHWESIPPRRRQYSFDRGVTATKTATTPMSSWPMNSDRVDPKSLSAARTRMFRWRIHRKRRSLEEVCELRRQCDELEIAYREYLNRCVEKCKQHFLRESWKERAGHDQRHGTEETTVDPSDDIQFVSELRVPTTYAKKNPAETSVTQLNRIITATMRSVCAIQRRNQLKLNTEQHKISIVRWDRILTAFRQKEVFIWNTLLTDKSTVLLLTTDPNDSIPVSVNIHSTTNILDVNNNSLPLVAKMLKMAVRNAETTQLAVLLFRLSSFWRVVGVMHSDKNYITDGLHASPSAEENPRLTEKIDQLHKMLIQRQKKTTAQTGTPVPACEPATVATPTDVVTVRSNLTLENLQNMNESQLQLLLPIPLSQDQRWLMMTLGNDFTHIWLPQWRKFLSHKRIRSALIYAAEKRKTIELSPQGCHPSVFVTSVRSNQIFVGPYHMHESQKLALFYRQNAGKMLLSENYARLPGVPPFSRRSIGSWIYTSANTATVNDTQNSIAIAPPRPAPTLNVAHNVNTQQPTSQLKIQNVYSMGGTLASKPATIAAGQSLLNPIAGNTSVVRVLNAQSAVTHAQNAPANISTTRANAKATTTKPSTSNTPIIITKVNQPSQKLPTIASIRSYGGTAMGKLPVISSVQSGEEVQQSLIGAASSSSSVSPSTVSEALSESVKSIEMIPVADPTPTTSENTSTLIEPMEIIDLSDDDEEDGNVNYTGRDPLSYGKISGYIICPSNKDLGKIPAEIVGNTITMRIGSCDKECELPLDLEGNESFDCLSTVDKYMSQLITNIAYNVNPKNILLKWKFCPESSPEHKSLPIHGTRSLNSYSVVFEDLSLSIQSNYSARTDLSDDRKFTLDVAKLASQILPRNVAKECQLKDVIEKAQEIQRKLESERHNMAKLKDRYSRMIAERLIHLRSLQKERKAVARAHGPE